MKQLSEEAYSELDQVERILAHFHDNYELSEEDDAFLKQVNIVFKIIHHDEDEGSARKKIKTLLGEGVKAKKIIDACTQIYGDFFTINQAAMRIIQEKRHERVYEAAMRNQDHPAAERALAAIDKLHRLYEKADSLPISSRKLPKIVRTADPAALKAIRAVNEE
jgi:hypothetical protein